ncbi:hypothetical protein RCG17_02850 [Neobacillus sp. PS3-12]|jgi:hypothetical protein|uniref:hypothetical protein n=1 Tax=Neobacillus sp. PS3-12 TaxID=3070677 RepID=UPI0027E05A9D|nr:hypothetical protein [Neobacillus sp. PS3-12]WML53634.1 hypothetical protein RCG17_02850 [Neobacillus sp. PS3-12]
MKWFIYYLAFQLTLVLIFWVISKRKDKRYNAAGSAPAEGFEPTQEVSIDPVTQVVTRVYVNPNTGERKYIEEKNNENIR